MHHKFNFCKVHNNEIVFEIYKELNGIIHITFIIIDLKIHKD